MTASSPEGLARDLPPVNSILANSTGEILPSELTEADFDDGWARTEPLESFSPRRTWLWVIWIVRVNQPLGRKRHEVAVRGIAAATDTP
jgi:hypothetical protein